MATTVYYTGKDGKAAQVTFPTRLLAEGYSKAVKGARLVDSETTASAVTVQKCPVATPDVQKAATDAYYRRVKTPKSGYVSDSSESRAEQMAEHFADCRAAGMTQADAWADWDYAQEGTL